MMTETYPKTRVRHSIASNPPKPRPAARWLLETLLPALIGFLVFAATLRTGIMRPAELQWLGAGDGAAHLVGLHDFVQEPWQLPPGKLTTYGDGVPTSVVYTDSVPLVALPWKAALRQLGITRILQPFGIFIAAGFCLQGIFGYRILRRLTSERWLALLGTPLLLYCPPLLQRLPGHLALGAHWIILWAFWLLIRPGDLGWRRHGAWLALLGTALGVHFYLFCMAGALYGAALLGGVGRGRLSLARLAGYLAALVALVAAAGWLFGYFVPADSQGDGYGQYKFNGLAFFNPMEGWSRLFPGFGWAVGGEYEGFAWLGTGLAVLGVAVSLPGAVTPGRERRLRTWKSPLLVAVLALLLGAAMTPQVNVGPLARVPSLLLAACAGVLLLAWSVGGRAARPGGVWQRLLTSPVTALAALLVAGMLIAAALLPLLPVKCLELTRSSGRMAWPVFYWLACWVIARTIQRFSRPVAAVLLAGCVALQAIDMAPKMRLKRHDDFPKGGLGRSACALPSAAISDALWHFCDGKKRLWVVMGDRAPREGDRLGLLSIVKGMAINRPWVARYSQEAEARREEEITGLLERGSVPEDVVFYVYPDSRIHASAAIERHPGEVEFVEENGFTVLTRAAHPSEELAVANRAKWRSATPCLPVEPGKAIRFITGGEVQAYPGAVSGFSDCSKSGAWTDRSAACVNLKAPWAGADMRLGFTLWPFMNPHTAPGQKVRVTVAGEAVAEWAFTTGELDRREAFIPGRLVPADRIVPVRLELVNAVSPKSLGISPDRRALGVHLVQIEPF